MNFPSQRKRGNFIVKERAVVFFLQTIIRLHWNPLHPLPINSQAGNEPQSGAWPGYLHTKLRLGVSSHERTAPPRCVSSVRELPRVPLLSHGTHRHYFECARAVSGALSICFSVFQSASSSYDKIPRFCRSTPSPQRERDEKDVLIVDCRFIVYCRFFVSFETNKVEMASIRRKHWKACGQMVIGKRKYETSQGLNYPLAFVLL